MSAHRPELVLLTGAPGSGKTTAVQRAVEVLRARGLRVGGFVTAELRSGDTAGPRVGFALEPLAAGGQPRTMAHRELVSRHRVGRYGVDVEVIDYVVDTTLSPRALADVDLIAIDEIGKMECLSRRFVEAIERLLERSAGPPLLATVAQRGSGLIAQVRQRPNARLLTVDRATRDALVGRLVGALLADREIDGTSPR